VVVAGGGRLWRGGGKVSVRGWWGRAVTPQVFGWVL
jgi:hypothetical protein